MAPAAHLPCPLAYAPQLCARSAKAAAAEAVATGLQAPHGGKLVNLQAPKSEWASLVQGCTKTIEASDRNACDVELLSVG